MERRKFTREFKLEAVRLIKERGVSYAQASQDLSVHQSQLRSWVKALADDPQHAFPGQGQMKPEQLEMWRWNPLGSIGSRFTRFLSSAGSRSFWSMRGTPRTCLGARQMSAMRHGCANSILTVCYAGASALMPRLP